MSLSLSRRERNAPAKACHGAIFSPCDVRSNIFAAFDADDKPGCQRLGPGATAHGRHDAWTTVFGRHKPHDEDVLPVPRPSTCAVPLSPYRTRRFSGCLQFVQCANTVQMLFTHDYIRVAGMSTLFFSKKKRMSTLLVYRVRITWTCSPPLPRRRRIRADDQSLDCPGRRRALPSPSRAETCSSGSLFPWRE